MSIKIGIYFLIIIVLFCNVCCAETLTVSVSFDGYFAPPDNAEDLEPDPDVIYFETPEYVGLREFENLHPDCDIKIIVDEPIQEDSEADIFLLSGSLTDIHKVLNSSYIQPIGNYLSEDIITNCLCLDKLVNKNNEIVAIPVYAWAFALYPNNTMMPFLPESEKIIQPDSVKTWDDIYVFGARLKKEGFRPPVIGGLPYMAYQLLGLTQKSSDSFENVKEQITDLLVLWKKMAEEGILDVPKSLRDLSFSPCMNSLLSFDHAYLFDILEAQTGIKNEYPFYMMPMFGNTLLSPLRMEVGVISSSCDNVPLAIEFLSTFTTMENQKLFAHSGIIRSDLYAHMKEEKEKNTEWIKEQEEWWGELASDEEYLSYITTVCDGFIPSITDSQLLAFAWNVANYLNDKTPITSITDWLESYYGQY